MHVSHTTGLHAQNVPLTLCRAEFALMAKSNGEQSNTLTCHSNLFNINIRIQTGFLIIGIRPYLGYCSRVMMFSCLDPKPVYLSNRVENRTLRTYKCSHMDLLSASLKEKRNPAIALCVCSKYWPGTSSSLRSVSALNPLSKGEYSFRFPGSFSFWNPRMDTTSSSICFRKLLSFFFSKSLVPLGPSSFSTSLANFCGREINVF